MRKNNGKSLTVVPKKWPRSHSGGGRLLEVTAVGCRAFTGKILVFGLAVAYGGWLLRERWSHMEVRLYIF